MATNIIERLFIEVGLDFSKLASEADKAIATSNKLEGSLSGTEKASGKANKALSDLAKGKAKASTGAENLAKGLTKAAKVLTGFFATLMTATGLNKLINEVQQANNELYFLEKNLGMSAQSIKSWQNAAAASGGTAEGMTASLKGLNRSMNDFVIMGDTSLLPYFNALGVSMVDGTGKVRELDDVMLDLSDSLSRMDRKQAYSIGAAMGLDEGTLNTLLQGRDAMQEMLDIQKSMYHSSEKELEASRELSKQQAILNAHWESLKTMLANVLIPVLLKLTKVVNEWMSFIQRNERQVRHVFEMLSFIIGMILIPLFGKALMAALAFIAPFAPFILVVAALSAAFILLYDDYKTWAEGGKSLFDWGAFTNYINTSRVSVENLKSAFAFLLTGYKSWSEFAANGGIWKMLSDFADDSWRRVVRLWEALKKIFEGDFSGGFGDIWELTKESYTRPFERVAGAIDTATDHEVGTLAGTDVISRPKQNMYSMDTGVEVAKSASAGGDQALQEASKQTANAADYATAHALKKSASKCAKYVNDSLRAQGIKVSGHGKDVANNLLNSNQGFKQVKFDKDYVPQKGDVMSMPSYDPAGQKKRLGVHAGHVAIFNGKEWVSDFKQGSKYGNTGAANKQYYDMLMKDPSKATIARKSTTISQPSKRAQQSKHSTKDIPIVKVLEAGKGYNIVELADGSIIKQTGDWNWRNRNQGNIEDGSFSASKGGLTQSSAKGSNSSKRFAVFSTFSEGRKAKEDLIFDGKNYRDLDLMRAIERYAPPAENDTAKYQRMVMKAAGSNKKMREYSATERKKIMDAIETQEGFNVGEIKVLKAPTKNLKGVQLANSAQQAQQSVAAGQQKVAGPTPVTNNKTVSVVVNGGVNVASSAAKIDGTVSDGFNAVNNRANQLITGMS